MKDYYKASAINRLLAQNCFGDYYTRKGLNLKDRELITLCFWIGQGDTEPQIKAHLMGNVNVGNSIEEINSVLHQLIPFVGYPRILNTLSIIQNMQQ